MNLAGIFSLLSHLYKCFLQKDAPPELLCDVKDYLGGKGSFSSLSRMAETIATTATKVN